MHAEFLNILISEWRGVAPGLGYFFLLFWGVVLLITEGEHL